MNLPSFQDFAAQARQQGFDEVLVREWDAHEVVDEHTHPFAVEALVVRGDLWLTVAGNTRHLRTGGRFSLDQDQPHAERYGIEGATYWVGRRSSAG